LDRHEDCLTRRWHRERHLGAGRAEGGNGITDSLAHGDGQHERRFPDGFAAIDDVRLRGVL